MLVKYKYDSNIDGHNGVTISGHRVPNTNAAKRRETREKEIGIIVLGRCINVLTGIVRIGGIERKGRGS
jgi:hypothetical protein